MDNDSGHWYEQPAIVARGARITSREIVKIMTTQRARWERLERIWARGTRILWSVKRLMRRLPGNYVETRG